MEDLIEKAANYLKEAAKPEKFKNIFHLDVPTGWMNDPNGLVEANGEFHLFYQHHPYAAKNGVMYWGHAVTRDFLHFTHLPPAIAPDKPYDADGCWSGSAIYENGRFCIMYTGCRNGVQQQCLAYSFDGVKFAKEESNPVIRTGDLPEGGVPFSFRDPFLIKEGGSYYALMGARDAVKNCGNVLVYTSADLTEWKYVGVLAENSLMVDPGIMECPNFIRTAGGDVLVAGLNFMPTQGELHKNFASSVGFVGKADLKTAVHEWDGGVLLDYGFDYYAPQILRLSDGRAVLIGWMQMWEVTYPTQKYGWVGSFAFPRELTVSGGRIFTKPARELDGACKLISEGAAAEGVVVPADGALRLKLVTAAGGFEIYSQGGSLKVECSADCVKMIRTGDNVPKSRTPLEEDTNVRIYPRKDGGEVELDLLLDVSSAEVFIDGGAGVMTSTLFTENRNLKICGGRYSLYKIEV